MMPRTKPTVSCSTFATGARQFVVHDAFEHAVIDAVDDRRVDVFSAGRRYDDFLRPGLQMLPGLLLAREETGAFEHDVDAERAPRQLRRIPLRAHFDAVAVDHEVIAVDADFERESAVRRVVARQMRVRLRVAEVVQGDDLNLATALSFVQRAKNVTTDPAITVDCDFDGHGASLGRPIDSR
jgi:hypothetical protein